jgi:uncharacterized protein YndB with AHSA1/START domain
MSSLIEDYPGSITFPLQVEGNERKLSRFPISRPPCLDHATARVQVDADPRDATSKQGERTASARFNFSGRAADPPGLTLVVRRLITASPQRLFTAWTDERELVRWWGPRGVVCENAQIDLRVGGTYRIANRLPDGRVVLISGEFDLIEPPNRIAYSWQVEPDPAEASRVIVSFLARGRRSEVVVTHERIASKAIRDDHRLGWRGCLEGLAAYMRSPRDW